MVILGDRTDMKEGDATRVGGGLDGSPPHANRAHHLCSERRSDDHTRDGVPPQVSVVPEAPHEAGDEDRSEGAPTAVVLADLPGDREVRDGHSDDGGDTNDRSEHGVEPCLDATVGDLDDPPQTPHQEDRADDGQEAQEPLNVHGMIDGRVCGVVDGRHLLAVDDLDDGFALGGGDVESPHLGAHHEEVETDQRGEHAGDVATELLTADVLGVDGLEELVHGEPLSLDVPARGDDCMFVHGCELPLNSYQPPRELVGTF
jgi:hypothetical protein